MQQVLKSKAYRAGDGSTRGVRYWLNGWDKKQPVISFSANYGRGTSSFSITVETADYETIIKGMLEADRDAAVLAIGKALTTTFEPSVEKK